MEILSFLLAIGVVLKSSTVHALTTRTSHSCSNIKIPTVPGAHILSIISTERKNYTVQASSPILPQDITNLSICEVNVTITHTAKDKNTHNDKVLIQIWLPISNWNGRFAGDITLAPFLSQGFAAASTDAGLSGDPYSPSLWALDSHGEVNQGLLKNFASRSVHDLAVVGKAVTASYYGKKAKYAYWNGCSTGGRQGLVEAQMFPEDFDGILAGAPAINWAEYVVAEQWPQVVMKEESVFPSLCELNAVVQAAVVGCDGLDGVKDGVISDVENCKFDPFSIVGSTIQCDGKNVTISKSVASVVQKIWDGPKTTSGSPLWYGLNVGAPMDFLAESTDMNGTRVGKPFFVNDAWIRYFLKGDPNFDISTVGSADLTKLFFESAQKYGDVIDSANPNLSKFRNAGGKLLVWHGEADPLIFPQGTTQYQHRVEQVMGGKNAKLDEFFRLFVAPGVDHCGLGATPGAIPSDPFGALVSWVENRTAPDFLPAETPAKAPAHFTRKICRYPLEGKYRGSGDVNVLESYVCE
ncbi:Tannase/feruloyl esterase [Halenospora varia]|nr:Tannase/feruloyl esterase [Halenospora varia]